MFSAAVMVMVMVMMMMMMVILDNEVKMAMVIHKRQRRYSLIILTGFRS